MASEEKKDDEIAALHAHATAAALFGGHENFGTLRHEAWDADHAPAWYAHPVSTR